MSTDIDFNVVECAVTTTQGQTQYVFKISKTEKYMDIEYFIDINDISLLLE